MTEDLHQSSTELAVLRRHRWVRHVDVDWERLRNYGRAVHAAFLDSLGELTDEHGSMPVDMTRAGLGMWEGRDLLELHGTDHPRIHGGEIACLKCIQGGVGWAESDEFRAVVDVSDMGRPDPTVLDQPSPGTEA